MCRSDNSLLRNKKVVRYREEELWSWWEWLHSSAAVKRGVSRFVIVSSDTYCTCHAARRVGAVVKYGVRGRTCVSFTHICLWNDNPEPKNGLHSDETISVSQKQLADSHTGWQPFKWSIILDMTKCSFRPKSLMPLANSYFGFLICPLVFMRYQSNIKPQTAESQIINASLMCGISQAFYILNHPFYVLMNSLFL